MRQEVGRAACKRLGVLPPSVTSGSVARSVAVLGLVAWAGAGGAVA